MANDSEQSSGNSGNVVQLYDHLERPVPALNVGSELTKEYGKLRSHPEIDKILSLLWKKDPYTYDHSHRVADLSQFMGQKLGFSNFERIELYLTALLHDVGKVLTPDFVLKKPGPLTSEEFGMMKLSIAAVQLL